MSKAYYFAKNFSFKEIMSLLCYSTKNPETLTSTQKITRLYRANLRVLNLQNFLHLRQDFDIYNEKVNDLYGDFAKMMKLEANSIELKAYFSKYEEIMESKYDPQMIIDESRPYAPAQSRYLVWSNKSLQYDPYGYYKPKLWSDKHPEANLPLLEDYPASDSKWVYPETFGPLFESKEE